MAGLGLSSVASATVDRSQVAGVAASGDRCGAALAAANFDGGTADELVIAAPGAETAGGHSRIATALQGIGQLRLAQGRVAEAEALLREALEMRRQRVGSNHSEIAELLLPLAHCLVKAISSTFMPAK